jgi:RHS repeat-associated protein
MGTGNFSVPLALPAGRNGFKPGLSLDYSTGYGHGHFGLGWDVQVRSIARTTSHGVPRYERDGPTTVGDTFILSGAEELVPIGRRGSSTLFRPQTDKQFAEIAHVSDVANTDDYWVVRTPDGLTSVYGTPGTAGDDPAALADPDQPSHVFSWKLARTEDPFGNIIVYEYIRELDITTDRRWVQMYLSRVQYVELVETTAQKQFMVSVAFEYEQRPDVFSNYRSGFEVRTNKRCRAIEVRIHPGDDVPVCTYELEYANDSPNGTSLLRRVTAVGFGDAGDRDRLPPLEFAYTEFRPIDRRFRPVHGPDLPAASVSSPGLALIDVTGDGLPDLMELNGVARYWRNRGGGEFDWARRIDEVPGGFRLGDPGVQVVDANGDGTPDLLVTNATDARYFPLTLDSGLRPQREGVRYHVTPTFSLDDPDVRLVDLDGDGLTDAIRSGSEFEHFFNDPDPTKAWARTSRKTRKRASAFPDVDFRDRRVRFADMTGDGLQDIVLLEEQTVVYWPNRGNGNWGSRRQMRDSPHLPWGWNPAQLLLGDVDGDGAADLVYIDNEGVSLWVNRNGEGWGRPTVIDGTPPMTDVTSVQLIDLLGTGVAGVLWSRPFDGLRPHLHFLDFTDGVKPYLLNAIDNNLGAETSVTYRPSTHFAIEDGKRQSTRWRTPVPFPVHVVAEVKTADRFSGGMVTRQFRYHDASWDGEQREFCGFGLVEELDTEEFEAFAARDHPLAPRHFSPPTLTKTWFHQGAGTERAEDPPDDSWEGDPQILRSEHDINAFLRAYTSGGSDSVGFQDRRIKRDALRALRGSTLRTEIYAPDGSARAGRPYSVTEHAYMLREESPPDSALPTRRRIFFPFESAVRTTRWERGDDPLTIFNFTSEFDEFGQPHHRTTIAMPRRESKRLSFRAAVVGRTTPDDTEVHVTHSMTHYARPAAGAHYRHDCVWQIHAFEPAQSLQIKESNPMSATQLLIDQSALARSIHNRYVALLDGWQPGYAPPAALRLRGHTVNHYDGPAFVGRDDGLTEYGALTRSEMLVLDEDTLAAAYGTGAQTRRPAYLGGTRALPAGAPSAFGSDIGYHRGAGVPYQPGYYVDVKRRGYDFQATGAPPHGLSAWPQRGVVVASQDARCTPLALEPDRYWLFVARTVDAVGLETAVTHNYRVGKPSAITDVNGNRKFMQYNATGLPTSTWAASANGTKGGTVDKPDIQYSYDLDAYHRSRTTPNPQPASVRTTKRVWHSKDNFSEETLETVEYSDGFGRVIQQRVQTAELAFGNDGDDVGLPADPGVAPDPAIGSRKETRVVVSGWQLYDNKGRAVERYEPLLSEGWDYQPETEAKSGRRIEMQYDPLGQVVRTLNPDGSQQRAVHGSPSSLGSLSLPTNDSEPVPAGFEPSPWESYTYDENDLAPVSTPAGGPPGPPTLAADASASHHFTPSSIVRDALGRTVCEIQRNGRNPTTDWYLTRLTYDIAGNLTSITDPLGRLAFAYVYDLASRPLRAESIDAGVHTSVLDAHGKVVEHRDDKGSIVLTEYDRLNRLARLWATNAITRQPRVTLRQKIEYGDQGRPPNSAQERATRQAMQRQNAAGKAIAHWDEAGLLQFTEYDFKGNLITKRRRVISDAALSTVSSGDEWIADWSAADADRTLDSAEYETTTTLDALNRLVEIAYPRDVEGTRRRLRLTYHRGGALRSIRMVDSSASGQETTYIEDIAYNAKGQRTLVAFGNGMMTRYAYDSVFRLRRLRTEPCESTDTPLEWHEAGPTIQDYTYGYDLVGNTTVIDERVKDCGIATEPHGRDHLVRRFTYDPLYRLESATGRACAGLHESAPRLDQASCGFIPAAAAAPKGQNAPDLTEPYLQTYNYDAAGNLLELCYKRVRHPGTAWRRRFGMADLLPAQWKAAGSNRATTMTVGSTTLHYTYDKQGNTIQANSERYYVWDHANRLTAFRVQPGATPSVEARYLYGADGLRVKKWVKKGAQTESTVYIDGLFEEHHSPNIVPSGRNNTLHILDSTHRVALVRVGDPHKDDAGPARSYYLADGQHSSVAVLSESGSFISREEFFPYGESSFGGFARKRYRYLGKERDADSGLAYHGHRYYVPSIGRWLSGEQAPADHNVFRYAFSNPIRLVDTNGRYVDYSRTSFSLDPQKGYVLSPGGFQLPGGVQPPPTGPGPGVIIGIGIAVLAGIYVAATHSQSNPHTVVLDPRQELDRRNFRMYQNGLISWEEYLAARASGRLAIQSSEPGDVTGKAGSDPARSAATPGSNQMPAWLQQIVRGNWYNKARLFDYPYHEVYIVNPAGGYFRLDAYDPGKAIVSRKFSQLSEVSLETAIGYIDELLSKYPQGAVIGDVTTSRLQTGGAPTDASIAGEGSLGGQVLSGTPILEVPTQWNPVPKAVTEYAEAHGVTIRSDWGQVYTKPTNLCCCSETK